MLAKKFHPDAGASDSKKFQEISEAWDVLKDDKTRKAYDDMGHETYLRFKENGQDPTQSSSFGQSMDLNDLFADIFGGATSGQSRRRKPAFRQPKKGEDLRLALELTFQQAIAGAKKSMTYSRYDKCSDCKGSGVHKNDDPERLTCTDCNGSGMVTKQMGFMIAQETCNSCEGSGSVIKNHCLPCHGKGRVRTKAEISDFVIPPGVDYGSVFQKINGGNIGVYGGDYGDLIIDLVVKKDRSGRFERNGLDIYSSLTIPLVKSLTGGSVEVKTPLKDILEVKVKPGTLHGSTLRMKNKGVKYGSKVGDFYLQIFLQPIESLTPRQKELLEEFDEEERKKHGHDISEVNE